MTQEVKKAALAFTFGDPETVLKGELSQYLGVYLLDNGQYYQTPIPWTGLARIRGANAYHWPTLEFKVNMVLRGFVGSPALSRAKLRKVVSDYMVFTNAYLQRRCNLFGQVIAYEHLAAINMRRAREEDRYCMLGVDGKVTFFEPGEVLHIKNYDVMQDVYGMPSYIGAIQSMLLQEDATLFRRRYYKNGAHMGYVFYSSSPQLDPGDQQAISKAVQESKGVGNFRNLFLHIPNGKEKDIQILPVGDFSTKDELEKIKNISRDDIIAAHRIPPALANIIPSVAGGLGDIEKADAVYVRNEIIPLREEFAIVNEELPPALHVRFEEKA
jgi:PBSX family phage portal protein